MVTTTAYALMVLQHLADASPVPTVPASTPSPDQTISGIVITTLTGAGSVGVFLLMVIFRFKIMPTYVHDEARASWDREREGLERSVEELKGALKDANAVYTSQVIPTLTRVLDAERELVDLRRDEQSARRAGRGEA